MVTDLIVLITIIILLSGVNSDSFKYSLNNYYSKLGVENAYDQLIQAGERYWNNSYVFSPNSFDTFLLVPFWFTVLFWNFSSTYLGGEVGSQKHMKIAIFLGFTSSFLLVGSTIGLEYVKLGAYFLSGASYYAAGFGKLPVIPNLVLFASLISNNPIFSLIVSIDFVLTFLLVIPWGILGMSRVLLAYSLDGIIPSGFSKLNKKGVPVRAVLVAVIGGEIFLVFLSGLVGPATASYAFLLYSYAAIATSAFLFPFTTITLILLPYRHKQVYESFCPIKQKVAKVPLVTVIGIVAFVYSLFTVISYTYFAKFYFGSDTLAYKTYGPFMISMALLFICTLLYYKVVIRD